MDAFDMSLRGTDHEAFMRGVMALPTRVRARGRLWLLYEEVMERFYDMFNHPQELVVHGGWNHALRHKVANGLCNIAETGWESYGALLMRYSRESGSPLASYVMTLANEKVRWRKSSWDDRGPRKAPSWRSSLP